MKKKNNHFQSDNNLNDTGQLCEKKLIVAVMSSFHEKRCVWQDFVQNYLVWTKTFLVSQKQFGRIKNVLEL